MNFNRAVKERARALRCRGTSVVELVCGIIIFLPLVLLAIDLTFVLAGTCQNKIVCYEAARAAASGLPDAICHGAPHRRAEEIVQRYATASGAIRFHPDVDVTETVNQPLPHPPLGGPVDGHVTVQTSADVYVPFVAGPIVHKDWMTFTATETFPYTCTVDSTQMSTDNGQNFSVNSLSDPGSDNQEWTVTISTKRLDNYLDYQASLLDRVVKASIEFSQTTYGVSNSGSYEDFYYSGFQPIGCVKHHSLDLTEGTKGTIRLKSSSSSIMEQCEANAAPNAIERVFLDLYLKNCSARYIIVPRSSFQTVMNGLCQYGFHRAPTNGSDQPIAARIILLVLSDPPGLEDRILY